MEYELPSAYNHIMINHNVSSDIRCKAGGRRGIGGSLNVLTSYHGKTSNYKTCRIMCSLVMLSEHP